MSAKWGIVPPVLPILPPELWLDIFTYATYVPGLLNADVEDPFESPNPAGRIFIDTRHELRTLRASLVTKRYLVRVCKRWRSLATPFLYEDIYIGRPHVLVSLSRVLQESAQQMRANGGTSLSLGWHARRLDIAGLLDDAREPLLAEIIACLPRLRVVCVSARRVRDGRPMPSSAVQALGETCGASLRKLRWDDDTGLQPTSQDIRALLQSAPRLRSLIGVRVKMFDDPTPLVHSGLRFAVLPFPLRHNEKQPPPLPALRQVFFDIFLNGSIPAYVVDRDGRQIPGIIPASMPSLNTIYIRLHSGVALQPLMRSLGHLPDVSHLILVGVGTIAFSAMTVPTVRLPPSVSHLGLHLVRDQASNRYYSKMFAFLAALSGPALRVVRLLNGRAVEDLTLRHTARLREGLAMLALQKYRLEDQRGHVLELPGSDV